MAEFDPSTAYANDWEYFPRVEDAEYRSPPDVGPKRTIGGLKAHRSRQRTKTGGPNSGLYETLPGQTVTVWNPEGRDFDPEPNGELWLAASGKYLILDATEDGFGKWFLSVQRLRTNDASSA